MTCITHTASSNLPRVPEESCNGPRTGSKSAEHGGFADYLTNVLLLLSNLNFEPRTITRSVAEALPGLPSLVPEQ
jgi:hypothetical protein